MGADVCALPVDSGAAAPTAQVVADIVYHPRRTALLLAAGGRRLLAPSTGWACYPPGGRTSRCCGPALTPSVGGHAGSRRGGSGCIAGPMILASPHGAALPDRRRVPRARPSWSSSRACPRAARSPSSRSRRELARRRLGYGRGPRMRLRAGRGRRSSAACATAAPSGRRWRIEIEQQRVGPQRQVAGGDVAGAGRPTEAAAHPGRAPATPTSPACRSTASPTPATCSSGPRRRETAARVAAGTLAKLLLAELGIDVVSATSSRWATARCRQARRARPRRPRRRRRVAGRGASTPRPRGDDRRDQGRRARTATRSVAWSRCSATACRSGSAAHVHWDRKHRRPARPGADVASRPSRASRSATASRSPGGAAARPTTRSAGTPTRATTAASRRSPAASKAA